MSQAVLAEEARLSQPFLSQIETDSKVPSLKTLRRIASALEVPLSELISESDKQPHNGAS